MDQPFSMIADLQDSKILIVDDTEIGRTILSAICSRSGFKNLKEAKDGRLGLEAFYDWQPDLVFLDMYMPYLDGLQLCQELQRNDKINDCVIIMLTSEDRPEFKVQAFAAGVTDFINKPINKEEVMARSIGHLERLHLQRQIKRDHARISEELAEAVSLQHIILPDTQMLLSLREMGMMDAAYHYKPTSELAGDTIILKRLDADHVMMIMVDISGHGVAAALYAFAIHSLFMSEAEFSYNPGQLLARVNQKLHEFSTTQMFATALVCVVNVKQRKISYASAGAPPPMIVSANDIQMIDTQGYLLGILPNATYETKEVFYNAQDVFFLYSDALIETEDANGTLFSEEEIASFLQSMGNQTAQEKMQRIIGYFQAEYGRQLKDDLSLLLCQF